MIVIAALVVGAFGWAWPGALNLAVVQLSPAAPSWAVGVMLAGLFAGAVAGPLAVGLLAHADHFELAWATCSVFALLAGATVLAVRAGRVSFLAHAPPDPAPRVATWLLLAAPAFAGDNGEGLVRRDRRPRSSPSSASAWWSGSPCS